MSRARWQRLHERRTLLVHRSTELRAGLEGSAIALESASRWLDAAGAGVVWLRRHPAWPVGLLTFAVVVRPTRVLKWSGRVLGAWRLWRRAQAWLPVILQVMAERR